VSASWTGQRALQWLALIQAVSLPLVLVFRTTTGSAQNLQ
jgi:hypothetical protein